MNGGIEVKQQKCFSTPLPVHQHRLDCRKNKSAALFQTDLSNPASGLTINIISFANYSNFIVSSIVACVANLLLALLLTYCYSSTYSLSIPLQNQLKSEGNSSVCTMMDAWKKLQSCICTNFPYQRSGYANSTRILAITSWS